MGRVFVKVLTWKGVGWVIVRVLTWKGTVAY